MLRMPRFTLATPRSLDEALELLSQPGAVPLAGGTDLLPAMKLRLLEPTTVVRLDGLTELTGVRVEADGLVLGALTRLSTLAQHHLAQVNAPALAMAAAQVASVNIRNSATLGGNVLLDARCRFFNQSHFWRKSLGFCLKKSGDTCHVVKGGKRCVAAVSSDTVPALVSLDAQALLASPRGRRTVSVESLFKGDGAAPHAIARDEVLLHITVPKQHAGHRGAYLKLRPRGSIDFPLLGVAVRLDVAANVVLAADVVVGALQSKPVRVAAAAKLVGATLGTAAFDEALTSVAERARKQCHPLPNIPGDDAWRHEMVPVFVRRAVTSAATS